jgi:hypothetical protein
MQSCPLFTEVLQFCCRELTMLLQVCQVGTVLMAWCIVHWDIQSQVTSNGFLQVQRLSDATLLMILQSAADLIFPASELPSQACIFVELLPPDTADRDFKTFKWQHMEPQC